MRRNRSTRGLIALIAVVGIVAAGCGGDDSSSSQGGGSSEAPGAEQSEPDGTDANGSAEVGESGDDLDGSGGAAAEPARGGDLVYALEAETSGGWCLPEAQLAISGQQVAQTIYDTLMRASGDGEYVPWLAESLEANESFDEFTIVVRDGVTFHDGTPLTGQVVKNNIDAWINQYEGRSSQLVALALSNIESTTLVDDMTVVVETTQPWTAFPAYMSSPRLGIMGQTQLDSDRCFEELVGTGPFALDEWLVNDHLRAVRNDDWWYADHSGVDYPYLDSIEYRPTPDAAQRLRGIQGGELDGGLFSGLDEIADLREMAGDGEVNLEESLIQTEVGYTLLNNAEGSPFSNVNARRALAYGTDRETNDQILTGGLGAIASGPFAPGSIGYLEDAGYPAYDPERAREFVAAYEAETGEPLSFRLTLPADPGNTENGQLLQQAWGDIGADVELAPVADQSQMINDALAGNFDAMLWRNHGGAEPDGQFFWWHSGFPTNFGRIEDPEVDRLLEQGRIETDPVVREQIYEDLNRRFADQVFNLWGSWTNWAVATPPEMYGVFGPDLPGGLAPNPGLTSGHPVYGLYFAQDG